ncbi:hypothetical protein SAMN05660226_01325 [Parapedobacter luteus]|uniref:Uncharacterized protein n=1 Tax=Parapedobacter luteus TaxID=623280 RepID=A0A1T5B3N3_9SPHI|nr:hypothetical protein SAMN05660226_01325 [Parapedobacter luteus]
MSRQQPVQYAFFSTFANGVIMRVVPGMIMGMNMRKSIVPNDEHHGQQHQSYL